MAVRPIDGTWSKFVWNLGEKSESLARKFREGKACFIDLRLAVDAQPTITPQNDPLTVKQLQKMVGEPVYDYLGQEWYVIQEYYGHELTMTDGTRFFDDDEIDGVDKRFYRRPPEGEGNV